MGDEEKQSISSGMEAVKEQGENLKEKADKTKKSVKIFMKLPTPVKIAIIVIPLLIIVLLLTFSGAVYILKKWKFTNIFTAKAAAMGDGTSYSKDVITIGTDGTWNIDVSDELKKKLTEAGINVNGMSQDELLIEYLKLNGLEEDNFSDEEIELIPYLIKAEIASQSVDLRKTIEMYDGFTYKSISEDEIKNNLKNNKINGVVHFKRVNTGAKYEPLMLEYINYSAFSGYINNNNYEEAKKYFSFNDKGELVIATWRYNKIEYTISNGYINNPYTSQDFPNSEESYVSEMVIDYKPLISKYTMPFEVLAALLENSDDIEFTKKVANLGFTTNIEITIFEKYTKTDTEITTDYYEYLRNYQWSNLYTTYEQNNTIYTIRDDKYSFLEGDNSSDTDNSEDKFNGWSAPEKIDNIQTIDKGEKNCTYKVKNFNNTKSSYKVKQKITTEDNTYVYGLTLADSWFIKTEKEYTIEPSENNDKPTENNGEYIDLYVKDGESYYTQKREDLDTSKIKTNYLEEYYNRNKAQIESKAENLKNEIESAVVTPRITMQEREDENGDKVKYISINCGYYANIFINNGRGGIGQSFYNVLSINPNYIEGNDYITVEDSHAKFYYHYISSSNSFYLYNKEIKNEITNIQSNYSQRTDTYKRTDSKTKEVIVVNSYDIKDNPPTSKLYDSKDEKFLKAYSESSKARGNIGSSPGWIEDFLDEYSPEVTTILKYLLDKYNGINSELKIEYIEQLLDVMDLENGNTFTGNLYGTSTEEKVWFALKDLGYSNYAIAGVMGNIYGESGFNPSAVEEPSGEGIGLCQWSYGRKTQLKNYAKSKQKEWSDIDTQIEFLITEIEGTGAASGYATAQMNGKYKGYTKNDWKEAKSVDDATTAFCYVFERPGIPRLENRINKAKEYYETYKNREKTSMIPGDQGVTYDGDGKYYHGHYTDSLGHTFTMYRQSNFQQSYWGGTIRSHGCGPSSCAIILSGLKDSSITPATVADGKNWTGYIAPMVNYLKTYDLKAWSGTTSNDEIKKYLKQGYKLIVNVQDGYIGNYYYKGHYYTIVDIDNNDNVFVIDPGPSVYTMGNNKGGGNDGWYSLDRLTGKAAVIYIK